MDVTRCSLSLRVRKSFSINNYKVLRPCWERGGGGGSKRVDWVISSPYQAGKGGGFKVGGLGYLLALIFLPRGGGRGGQGS